MNILIACLHIRVFKGKSADSSFQVLMMSDVDKSKLSKHHSIYLALAQNLTLTCRDQSAIIENSRTFSIPCVYRVFLFSSWFYKPMKLVLCSLIKLRMIEPFWELVQRDSTCIKLKLNLIYNILYGIRV